jgi:hypothetical protein
LSFDDKVIAICILKYVMDDSHFVKQLTAQWITTESFQQYGQVIYALETASPTIQWMLN